MDDSPLLAAEKASFGYGAAPVLTHVSLQVRAGEFVGLIGPNGAGKTTLFRGLLGLLIPQQGRVRRDPSLHGRIGYVPQRDTLDPIYPVTAQDVVEMGVAGSRPWYRTFAAHRDPVIAASLARVGLSSVAGHDFSALSGGQRQRVLIARALAAKPALLVLDEPTAGVDTEAETVILDLLSDLNAKEHLTLLMVSHDLPALKRHARRVLVVDQATVKPA